MADARDFLPEAGPPPAEESQAELRGGMNIEDVKPEAGAYVLLGSDELYMYKGSARDLHQRVTDHFLGRVARTRNRRPLRLIHIDYTTDYTEARRRENWLKSGQGRRWLREQYARVAKWQTQGT